MADYDLKTITPSATVTDGTTILFGAEGQTATPQPYTTAAIKAWIASFFTQKSNNLSDVSNTTTARNNIGAAPPVMPVYGLSTMYLSVPFVTAAGAALTANRMYMCPIIVPESRSFTSIAVQCTVGVASAAARIGLYNASQSTRQPTTLIAEATSDGSGYPLDLSTSGTKTCAISQTLAPGLYYLCLVSSSTATVTMATNAAPNFLGAVITGSTSVVASRGGFFATTYGALSGIASGDMTGTTFTWDSPNIPVIGIR